MKARAAVVGRRLALGTWLQLEAWGRWLGAGSHADGAGIVRLGVLVRRVAVSIGAAVFYGALLQRAPGAIYAVPVVWAVGAWQMSDSSATPPPPLSADVYDAHSDEIDHIQEGPGEGLTILYPKRVKDGGDR
ncbi:hypothetical protein ACWD11_03150 [Streptomyces sp. NPDC002776]